jgi:hypothetical protein
MDEVKRQLMEHLLMENEWETAFNIYLQMDESMSLILAWAKTDLKVHLKLFELVVSEIRKRVEHMEEFKQMQPIERMLIKDKWTIN